MTLEKFYPTWLQYKSLHTNSSTSIRRYDDDWKRFYVNDPIIKQPLNELTTLQLDIWAHSLIKKHHMTKRCYYNMSLIIRQALHYAHKLKLIPSNPFADVKVKSKLFTETEVKKEDYTQVFLVEEVELIIEEAIADFHETRNLASLAIPFAFQTGLRLGELVATKLSDIKGRYLHIQRMEVREETQNEQGKWLPAKKIVVSRTKSQAGNRNVYLTDEAMDLISCIKKELEEQGFHDEDYLFQNSRGRITSRAVDTRIRKYCDHINILQKSTHKVRKTYISTLIDAGININEIRKAVGHEDEKTTYKNYCYNRYSKEQTSAMFESALKVKNGLISKAN